MRKFFLKWGRKLGHYSNHWWYGPLIGLVAALDAFIFVISNEAILFPTVWARPQKWFSTATWLTLGSAVGATAFACLTSSYGAGVVEHFFPHALDTHSWKETVMFIDRYGAWGLAFVSFCPLPQHVAVAVAGLAHMKSWTVFGAIMLGRGAKYIPLAWIATHTPRLLKKWHLIPPEEISDESG
jgi:membrane protein YqaA with SNARE-associated domain